MNGSSVKTFTQSKSKRSQVYEQSENVYVCVCVCKSAQFATIGSFQQIPGTQAASGAIQTARKAAKIPTYSYLHTHTCTQTLFVHTKQMSRKQRERMKLRR